MKLFLIRHAETVHNVAQVYAGSTDSPLTVHGSIQARRLGTYFASCKPRITQVLSSDLQRAVRTAESLLDAQKEKYGEAEAIGTVLELPILQERDFGPLERESFTARSKSSELSNQLGSDQPPTLSNVVQAESKAALRTRADEFINQYIISQLRQNRVRLEPVVAVVSHGIMLSSLWRSLLHNFCTENVRIAPDLPCAARSHTNFEHLGAWSNTGFLELHIHRLPMYLQKNATASVTGAAIVLDSSAMDVEMPSRLEDWVMSIKAIDCKDHLIGLKRTGGGVGSSQLDEKQPTIQKYFKRQKVE